MSSIIFRNNDKISSHDFQDAVVIQLNVDSKRDIDYLFSETIEENLSATKYVNIFIPLVIGSLHSDFLGLRMALHVRTTNSPNRCANVFLYGTESYGGLREHKFFDILKTKGVFLIDYSLASLKQHCLTTQIVLEKNSIVDELTKINMPIPSNYEDDHSIANEWAISRWADALNINDDAEINSITTRLDNRLYFKYLSSVYPKPEPINISSESLKITTRGKVLYIDDEADKGWCEIFDYILRNSDGVYFDDLAIEFKDFSKEKIIEEAIKKVKDDDIDLVILDFRLTEEDFFCDTISKVTGFEILKRIKLLNPGIQVLIFSATNKVWNLQALLDAKADGFILKEGVQNSKDENFTKHSIEQMINSVRKLLQRNFLKTVFIQCNQIRENLNIKLPFFESDYRDFIKELLVQIKMIESSAMKISLSDSMSLDIVFLNCYNFLESFKTYYLNEEGNQLVMGVDGIEINRYKIEWGEIINDGKFSRNNSNDNPSWFNCITALCIDYLGIAQLGDKMIEKINKIKDKRNDYIHGDKKSFDQNELLMILNLCVLITGSMRE